MELDCGDNQLAFLDVRNNTALRHLSCARNRLTVLDISNNTALEYLECSSNQLKALDVNKNIALTTLSCRANQLTTLDVSKNTILEGLYCYNNRLTTIDVGKNIYLRTLDCSGNSLTELNVTNCSYLTELEYDEGIKVYGIKNVDDDHVSVAINAANFPDEVFREYVRSEFDEDNDGYLSQKEIASAERIFVYDSNISSIKGIEYLTALTYLSCVVTSWRSLM